MFHDSENLYWTLDRVQLLLGRLLWTRHKKAIAVSNLNDDERIEQVQSKLKE